MMNEQAILDVLDRIRNRFYGKYRGVVIEIEEGGRGRIKAKVPAVLGDQKSGWCDPCVPYAGKDVGFAFLPEPGSGVWIEFEGGDVSHPIWSGCYWRDGEIPADAAATKKVIRTKSGSQLLLDDDEGSIAITNKAGMTIIITSDKVSINDDGLEVT
jgi:uncharacterized protein involved in type VI secretion and phage assembly